jgi:hypothetical protein
VVQNVLDVGGLVVAEQTPRAERSAVTWLRQGLQTAVAVGGPPTADGFAGDAEEVGDVGLGEAPFACPQGAQPQGVEDFVAEQTGIREFDRHDGSLGGVEPTPAA